MTISVTGAGNLGSGHALTLAHMRHEVIGLDPDSVRITYLANCSDPSSVPGFANLLQAGHRGGRPTFTADPAELAAAETHFLCVGTPQSKVANDSDLPFLPTAVEALLPHLRSAASRAPV
ncbi:hypothetical protein [Paeniglutamicibacter sp.]|uniref:hypothetical protein n=1 Tax=Paeniglutamicibacter sp. TaxID=1934391 RepID=UPI0039893F5F